MLFKFGLIVALAVGFAAAFRPMAPMRLQKGISSLRMMSDLVVRPPWQNLPFVVVVTSHIFHPNPPLTAVGKPHD